MQIMSFASLLISAEIAVFSQSTAVQAPVPKLEFEVASVKISPPITGTAPSAVLSGRNGPGTADPGQLRIGRITMKSLLIRAFDVRAVQISGPAWLDKTDGDHYDIVAKLPPGSSKGDGNLMLQNLLVERFGLAFHRETKEVQGYELIVGKNGMKLKESQSGANPPPADQPLKLETGRNGLPQLPVGRPGMILGGAPGRIVISARQQTMAQLASVLESRLGSPVLDKTGLTANYDFGFAFDSSGLVGGIRAPVAPAPSPQSAGAAIAPQSFDAAIDSAPSLFTAVQQELGLRLDQKKVTVELLVIDRLERVPAEN